MKKRIRFWEICQANQLWFLLIILTDFIFIVFLWLIQPEAFFILAGLMVFFSMVIFLGAVLLTVKREAKREEAAQNFLKSLGQGQEYQINNLLPARERRQLEEVGRILRGQEQLLQEHRLGLQEYEEYMESWIHEIKTPLSLMTLVLDNRKDEISPFVQKRMEYVRNQIQSYVNQILCFSRLNAVHKDYLFERVSLWESSEEVLGEFQMLLMEHKVEVVKENLDKDVLTDRKGFLFMLNQVMSNAIKYVDAQKERRTVWISARENKTQDKILLTIKDNGVGVRPYDLPFVFDKGFVGEPGAQRKKSTGMGLYLVKQMAKQLNIQVLAKGKAEEGFEIEFEFPKVEYSK